ncbi:hypothetical protein Pcinc_010149 [Petrolisthes cinctipes]|uniref:Uncharacterized protein n=1 Tax=Petrolisthes cinctipes TaxID=88211 RepID=A0AAE1G9M4_PETCI|nr:hypothetical protein Pcinc_010149 [Petrolisthes cinctipes]
MNALPRKKLKVLELTDNLRVDCEMMKREQEEDEGLMRWITTAREGKPLNNQGVKQYFPRQTTSKVEDCAVAVLDEEEPDTSLIVPPSTERTETWRHVKECSGEAAASRVNCETIEVLPRDVPVGVPGIHRGRGRNEAAGVQGGENSESS